MQSCSSFPGKLFGQPELHSFELSMCGISSLGSRMELGTNSSVKQNPGTMGLGPLDAFCQLQDPERNFHVQTASESLEDMLKYLGMVWVLTTIQLSIYQEQLKVCFALKMLKVQTLEGRGEDTFIKRELEDTSVAEWWEAGGDSKIRGSVTVLEECSWGDLRTTGENICCQFQGRGFKKEGLSFMRERLNYRQSQPPQRHWSLYWTDLNFLHLIKL